MLDSSKRRSKISNTTFVLKPSAWSGILRSISKKSMKKTANAKSRLFTSLFSLQLKQATRKNKEVNNIKFYCENC